MTGTTAHINTSARPNLRQCARRTGISGLGLVALAVLGAGCTEPPPSGAATPAEGEWETVVDASFDVEAITALGIGGGESNDNFANRGDIEINFDAAPGKIKIEMRRFNFIDANQGAQAQLAKLQPWAYVGSLDIPADKDPLDDCSMTWQDGCTFLVYYDGQLQPSKAGAHIRVSLPPDYIGSLELKTEDNVEDSSYQRRSDITVNGAIGPVIATLDSGRANVKMAAAMLVAPTCGSTLSEATDNNDSCAAFEDPDTNMPAAWSDLCACGTGNFGQVTIRSTTTRPADITLDLPADIWAAVATDNEEAGLLPQVGCAADVDGFSNVDSDPTNDPLKPWKQKLEFNDPGNAALEGGGVAVTLISGGCNNVQFHANPETFGEEPASELRGNVVVCSGCLN